IISKRKGQDVVSTSAQKENPSANPGAINQSSSPVAAPSVQNSQAPAGAPKPADSAVVGASKPKGDQKLVSISPITKSEPPAGRSGRTDPPTKSAAPPTQNVPSAPNKGNFTIQVGSFKDQGEADTRASRLKSAVGGEVRVVKANLPGNGV